jgi:putative transposase
MLPLTWRGGRHRSGMARLLRVEHEGAIHHVTVRSNSGNDLYRNDQDREYFLYRLGESAQLHEVRVYLYCLMSNHFHLLVQTPRGNLGRFMHSLLTGYTIFYNRRHRTHGHVTQGRYGARLVSGDDYLLKLSRYVHLNPVKVETYRTRPLPERLKALREYRWSSLSAYAGRERPPAWLHTGPMLALVEGAPGERTCRYASYVEAGVAQDDEAFQTELMRSSRSIGDEVFRAEVDARYAQVVAAARRPEDAALRRTAGARVAASAVLNAVAAAGGVGVEEVSRRQRDSFLKAIAASLLIRYAGMTQREIATALGLRSGSSVSHQLRRLRCRLCGDKALAGLLDRAERRLRREATPLSLVQGLTL